MVGPDMARQGRSEEGCDLCHRKINRNCYVISEEETRKGGIGNRKGNVSQD